MSFDKASETMTPVVVASGEHKKFKMFIGGEWVDSSCVPARQAQSTQLGYLSEL